MASASGHTYDEELKSLGHEQTLRPWKSGDPYVHRPFQQDSWDHCRKLASKYDAEMCNTWKGEIDNLLIFAGLFSATVTAFAIDSYKWLQPDPSNYSDQVLTLIYQHLASNSTLVAQNLASIPNNPIPQGPVVRINVYWFLALTLSLTTVVVGTICAQWLREFQREVPLSAKERLAIRQMRYQGLVYWRVPKVIAMLPLLLQTGFILFFLGLCELLWNLNKEVAIPVTGLAGSVLFFYVATTWLPTIQYMFPGEAFLQVPQCPYKSPQSLGLLRSVVLAIGIVPAKWKASFGPTSVLGRLFNSESHWSWPQFDAYWHQIRYAGILPWKYQPRDDLGHALDWIVATYSDTTETIFSALTCLQDLPSSEASDILRKMDSIDQQGCELTNLASTLSADLHKDLIALTFLREYQGFNPALKACYWECQIRLMNSEMEPQHAIEWPSTNFDIEDIPEDVQLQLLAAIKLLIIREIISSDDIQGIFHILKSLMAPEESNLRASHSRLALIFDLFEVLESWLDHPNDPQSLDTQAKGLLCANGIRLLVYPDFHQLWGECHGYEKFLSLAMTLDRLFQQLDETFSLFRVVPIPTCDFVEHTNSWSECMCWVSPKGVD